MALATIVVISLFVSVLTAPLPTVQRKCGNVSLSETVITGARIDDYQVYYLDNLKIIFLLVLRDRSGAPGAPSGTQLFRSTDEGLSWTAISQPPYMEGVGPEGISRIFHSKAADNTVTLFFLGGRGDGKMWVSKDKGETYELINNIPTGIYWFDMHDMFPGTALARAGVYGGDWSNARHKVYYVTEYGKKWTQIAEVPDRSRIAWSDIANVSPNRVYIQNYTSSSSTRAWDSRLIYSDDYFKTYTTLSPENVYRWSIIAPNRLVVTTCKDVATCASKQLWISENGGKTFELATFPDRDHEVNEESDVWAWEMSDDSMWVDVRRDCDAADRAKGICSSDLFHSYASDKEFTLSLKDSRRGDFTKYNSLNGIYIANQYYVPGEPDIRSLITFNKGSSWDLLQAPSRNANGQVLNCRIEDGCGLHLHGWSSSSAFFYSVDNAVGVMLASGNTGKKLELRKADVSFYYSRNGGLQWQEVRRGEYIMEIGDHGSVIVAAALGQPTNKVIYTVNDGDEWMECDLGSEISVQNIRVDVGWDSKQFILYGTRRNNQNQNEVVIVHLNFDDAYLGKCGPSDFEEFTPQAEHGNCFMGVKTSYNRRKFGRACYYGPDYKIVTKSTPCTCTKEDYECEKCFYRPALGEACVRECGWQSPPQGQDCTGNLQYYSVAEGYVKIEEDHCIENGTGFAKPRGLVSCHYKNTRPTDAPSGLKGLVIAVLFAGLIWGGLAALFAYLWKNNTAFHNFISSTFGIGAERDGTHGESLAESADEEVLTPGSEGVVDSDDLGLSSAEEDSE